MPAETAPTHCVRIILDPLYGVRLHMLPPGEPAWVVMSPANAPAVQDLWVAGPDESQLTGITGMVFDPEATVEDYFIGKIDTIDIHHGTHSGVAPYTMIEVIGLELSERIRVALADYGFVEFASVAGGFTAGQA